MFTRYRIAFRANTKRRFDIVWTAMAQSWNKLKSFTHVHLTSCRSNWPRGFGELNPRPSLRSWIRFTSVSVDSVLAPTYLLPLWSEYLFTLHQKRVQNLSDLRFFTFEIGEARRSLRNHAEITISYVWTEAIARMIFVPGARAVRDSVIIALIGTFSTLVFTKKIDLLRL